VSLGGLHSSSGKIARGSLRFAESTASERPSALTAKNLRELGKRRLTPRNGRKLAWKLLPHQRAHRMRKTSGAYNSGDLSPRVTSSSHGRRGRQRGLHANYPLPPFRWYIHRHLLDDSVWACLDAIPRSLAWMRDLSLLTMNYRVPLAGKLRPRSRLSTLKRHGARGCVRFSQRGL